MRIKYTREVILPVQNAVRMCKQITVFVFCQASSALVTLLKFTLYTSNKSIMLLFLLSIASSF
jgi:hypothetical protein